MSNNLSDLTGISDALVELVRRTTPGLVAVKAGAYRTASGVAIDPHHVAVPEHALRRRDSIPLRTHEGAETHAKVLGRDPGVDLAILQVDGLTLTPLTAVDPTTLKAGSLATVVGLTNDVGPSVSLGILGAVGEGRRTWRGGFLDQFLRLDVNLYPSQSGAAVVNADGHLIGMATPGLSRHSTLAVSVGTLHRVLNELKKEGRIRHGHLGVAVQPVAIPANLRVKLAGSPEQGLILLNVVAGLSADRAGLQVGDILLSLDGKYLPEVEDLQTLLRGELIGKPVPALILRGGEPQHLTVTVDEAPAAQQSKEED